MNEKVKKHIFLKYLWLEKKGAGSGSVPSHPDQDPTKKVRIRPDQDPDLQH
jgi:hypothetical protein